MKNVQKSKDENTVFFRLDENSELTQEQIEMLDKAAKRPIVYDEESPALTLRMKRAFKKAAAERNRRLSKTSA